MSTISKTNNTHKKKEEKKGQMELAHTMRISHNLRAWAFFHFVLVEEYTLLLPFTPLQKVDLVKASKAKRAFCIKTRITSKQFAMWKFPLMILFWFCHSNASSNAFHAFLAMNSMRSNQIWIWPLLLLLHKSSFLCMRVSLSLRLLLFVADIEWIVICSFICKSTRRDFLSVFGGHLIFVNIPPRKEDQS